MDRIMNSANDDGRQIATCLFTMLESSVSGVTEVVLLFTHE